MMRYQMGWRMGILFVTICIVVGLMVGWGITKAQGDSVSARPVCGYDGATCIARVYNRRDGARKYRHNRLGHAAHRMRYPHRVKRIIVAELLQAQRRNNRTARVMTYRTGAELWHNFTMHDNCVVQQRSPGAYAGPPTSCQAARDWIMGTKTHDWDRQVVRGVICGTIAGIGVGGALAAGAGGPWVWAGIGAGALACMWGGWLENQAAG